MLALLFSGFILIGTVMLKLPASTAHPIRWLDALFTATSAVTVTGLAVVDTGADFTRFGQFILMVLIQLGGLGMMTFTVMVLSLLGQRLSIRQQILLKEDLNQTSLGDLVRMVRIIAVVVITTEIVGALLLAIRFVPQFGWSGGLFYALFHAISAFNNAGFSLFPDSLTRYATDPWVNLIVVALIIIGGLGFSVLNELNQRRRWTYLSLHTRLTLVGTGILLLVGTVGFASMEWHNPQTLAQHASAADRLLISFFQSVTSRTAGFNTVDMASMKDSTALMFLVLMFIGGGSTSTAGGIKVTTFMVLCIVTFAFVKGSNTPKAFGRSISPTDVVKVLSLVFVSSTIVVLGTFVLTLTQSQPFFDLLFETVSALGTVGLSRNMTATLNDMGRVIIIVMMFLGRIGPLTLGMALARGREDRIRYPTGKVFLG
ncbi:TrkH family potassium uptake protein [Collimonas pratensis]|uniref:Ktr system potassium uptake protein B n=1 Tax=Collimonas pratensis TaxID=279113 RepID=A0A127Q511_9BURK|nr:TrkH family potassium uptake protein [Collimonas pratensis]AMP05124.1 ktr system potassium uptake protein B [Collimonas pratensis]